MCHGPAKPSPSFMHNYLHEILPYYSEWPLHEFLHVCELQQACIFIILISYWWFSYPNKQVLEVFYDQTLESQSARCAHHELLQRDYWWRQERKARIPSEADALKTFRSWTMTNKLLFSFPSYNICDAIDIQLHINILGIMSFTWIVFVKGSFTWIVGYSVTWTTHFHLYLIVLNILFMKLHDSL